MFPLFQAVEISPDCHNFTNMMDSGLTISSTSFFKRGKCVSPGPMDFSTCMSLRRSQTWSAVGIFLISQFLPLSVAAWALWLEHFSVKTEGKSNSVPQRSLYSNPRFFFLLERAHIFSSLSFIANTLQLLFLLPLMSPDRFNFIRALGFLTWSQAAWTIPLVSCCYRCGTSYC